MHERVRARARARLTVRQSRPGGTVDVHEGHGSDIAHRAQRPRRRVFNLMKVRNLGKVGGGLHAGEGEGWGEGSGEGWRSVRGQG